MYVIAYDFGTTVLKTCLFSIGSTMQTVARSVASYNLYILENGGAEQDVDEWWQAVCSSTKELFKKTDVAPEQIVGIAFCAQMQGVVLVDEHGNALRRPMCFVDHRGVREFNDCMGKGIVKVDGCSLYKLARNLLVNYAGSVSVKDPVWKYKWVENNEPEIFSKVYKWLDVGDYLVSRCTGRIVQTADSSFATFLYDTRKGRRGGTKASLRCMACGPSICLPSSTVRTSLVASQSGQPMTSGSKRAPPFLAGEI